MLRHFLVIFIALVTALAAAIPASATTSAPDSLEAEAASATELAHPKLCELFSRKFNLKIEAEDPIELFSFVARWLGTPYRYGGLSKRGVDCQGFVRVIYDSLYCQTLPAGAGSQYHVCDPVPKDSLQAGDLLFFTIGTRSISHVGIYLKDGWFAHATVSGVGVVMSRLDAPYYRRWFFRAGRVRPQNNAGLQS